MRPAEVEDDTGALAINYEDFSCNARKQLREVFDPLRELMTPDPPKRPIGFITHEDKGKKPSLRGKS